MNQRIAFGLKCTAFAIMGIAVAAGHPPSRAQGPVPMTVEDARQDADIQHNAVTLAEHATVMSAMNLIVVQQGQDLARLDTKMSMLFGILSLIQGGGIAVSVMGKKRS